MRWCHCWLSLLVLRRTSRRESGNSYSYQVKFTPSDMNTRSQSSQRLPWVASRAWPHGGFPMPLALERPPIKKSGMLCGNGWRFYPKLTNSRHAIAGVSYQSSPNSFSRVTCLGGRGTLILGHCGGISVLTRGRHDEFEQDRGRRSGLALDNSPQAWALCRKDQYAWLVGRRRGGLSIECQAEEDKKEKVG